MLHRYRGELDANEGMNFITERSRSDGERVQTVCLDQFCQEHSIDKVDLLKIDIQGQEYAALKGAGQLIRAGRITTIFMELTESVQFLKQSHYLFSKPGKRLDWLPAGDWLRSMNDVIARRALP